MTGRSAFDSGAKQARAWLSRSLTELFDEHYGRHRYESHGEPPPPHFDVLIVGSGYGGAVAAASLAGSRTKAPDGSDDRPLRIAVLERGEEYLPGAFPSQLSELPGHVRFSLPGETSPKGTRSGLFDLRVGADIVSVVANGVGGGSLINAGVMLPALHAVLAEAPWPLAIRSDPAALDLFYARIAPWLGAGTLEAPNTVVRAGVAPAKFDALRAIGGAATVGVPITVALGPNLTSSAGVAMNKCIGCGDCAIGCNHGAKDSLDVNLLVHAQKHEVAIYTGATVLRLEKAPRGWSVVVTHTDPSLRHRQKTPLRIAADKVILAAGTFGSTEILLRSRDHGLPMSHQVGKRFSGNGDLLAAAYDTRRDVNALATETMPPAERNVGPTITGAIDDRRGDPEQDLSIQELAVPGPLRRLFEEIFTSARTLHSLGERDRKRHTSRDVDRNAVDPAAFPRTVPLALIGRDSADGELVLAATDAGDAEGDGAVHVRWPQLTHDPRFDRHHDRAQRLLKDSGSGGRLLPNPAWKLQPDDAAQILGIGRGPLLTVHPLGGCPMGDDVRSGAVNDVGQVFTADLDHPTDVYPDLVVLDGAIVPTSLGINPALTIAALALRAIETLREKWACRGPGLGEIPNANQSGKPLVRPKFRKLPAPVAPERQPTKVQLIERLQGKAKLADGEQYHLELTLHSHPAALTDLMSGDGKRRRIDYDPDRSVLRVFQGEPSPIDEDPLGAPVPRAAAPNGPRRLVGRATVEGSLHVVQLAPTRPFPRTLRALLAWFLHRGFRDLVQRLAELSAGLTPPADPMKPRSVWWKRYPKEFKNLLGIASRAGAVRILDYRLQLRDFKVAAEVSPAALFGEAAAGRDAVLEAHGTKTLTYDGRLSPWLQLMELELDRLPGLPRGASVTMTLDLPYLARQGVALLRVVGQHDHVHGLVDLASFYLYMLRTVVDGHLWSFRRPDRVPDRVINRLPGATRDLPAPEPIEIQVDEVDQKPVRLRLTRYRPVEQRSGLPPVLLIHGYSASGTTFVHPTLRPGLAAPLVQAGRDVWVLDLRSSAGMPWATYPWSFEQIGREDIPVAIDYVGHVCGGKVDVVAHCMGAAMLCMAVLGDIPKNAYRGDNYPLERSAMRDRIRRIVLSQVGPLVMLSPSNQARAFLMRYVRQLIPMGDYRFRPDGDGSLADMLLDRLLATLPYPRDEFRTENPLWPPGAPTSWVQARRRMDALYGQVFKLTNVSSDTLEHLDDLFGPMSVETVSQVIHFARSRTITDARGRHVFATPDRLRLLERYQILSIHGEENCLADPSTADLLRKALDPAHYRAERFPGFGHQDCLIGKNAHVIFDKIVNFLGASE